MSLRENVVTWARDKQALAAEIEEHETPSPKEGLSVSSKVKNIVIGVAALVCLIILFAMRQTDTVDPNKLPAPTTSVSVVAEAPESIPTTVTVESTTTVPVEATEVPGTTTTTLEENDSDDDSEPEVEVESDSDKGAGLIESVKEKYAELKEDISEEREKNKLESDAKLDEDEDEGETGKKEGCERTGSRIVTRCSRSLLSEGRSGGRNIAPGYSSYSTSMTINDLFDSRYDLEYYDIETTEDGVWLVDPNGVSDIFIPFEDMAITETDDLDPGSLE